MKKSPETQSAKPDSQRNNLNRPLTSREIESVNELLCRNESAGPDGATDVSQTFEERMRILPDFPKKRRETTS